MPAYLPVLLSAFSLLLALFALMRREVREDGQTTSQRLKKLEAGHANHETRHTGHVQALATLADTLGRDIHDAATEAAAERKRLLEGFERRCSVLEKEVEKIPQIRETMARMEVELSRLKQIENKLDRLTEMLSGLRLGGQ